MIAKRHFTTSFLKKALLVFFILVIVSVISLSFFLVSYYSVHKSSDILKRSYFLYMDAFSDMNFSIDENSIQEKDKKNIIFFEMSEDVLISSPSFGVPVAYLNGKGLMRKRGFVTTSGYVHMGERWDESFMVRGYGAKGNELDAPSVSYETISFHELIQKIRERKASRKKRKRGPYFIAF